MTTLLKRFWADDGAATTIEYGLMVALLSLVIIASVSAMADKMDLMFKMITDTIAGTKPE